MWTSGWIKARTPETPASAGVFFFSGVPIAPDRLADLPDRGRSCYKPVTKKYLTSFGLGSKFGSTKEG